MHVLVSQRLGGIIKITKLFCCLMCYSGLLIGAAQLQETPLEEILREQTIRETLLPYVPARDIGRLSSVSSGMHEVVEPAITEAMEKAAIWESYVLNARDLNLSFTRENRDNQAFKDYIIRRIKNFAIDNPGTWINLNLSFSSLGNDLEFLKDLLQAIVTTVHSLKIDLASLDL